MSRLLALFASVPLLLAAVPAAVDAAPTCFGKPATIAGHGALTGTKRADVIVGGPGADRIRGGGGNDRICSGGGDDEIEAGSGSDRVEAGPGDDAVVGGNGSDEVRAGNGSDTVRGNRGNDRLLGEAGPRDFLDAGLGDDTLDGGAGEADQVIGGLGNDHLAGGEGDYDLLRPDYGRDTIDGGAGLHDTVSFAVSGRDVVRVSANERVGGGVQVDLATGAVVGDGEDTLTGIEDVIGTAFVDTISGDAEANVLYGGGGIDELQGVGPGDSADGGSGLDLCRGFEATSSCELDGHTGYKAEAEAAFLEAQHAGGRFEAPPPRLEVDLAGGASAGSLTAVVDRPYAFGDALRPRPGVSVVVSFAEGAFLLTAGGIEVEPGDGCQPLSPGLVRCPVAGAPEAVLISGSGGADVLRIDPSVPDTVSALISGGFGTDLIEGGSGDDILDGFSDSGRSVIRGGSGDDSLTTGALLEGGPGSDLLIASPCDAQKVDGGAGVDSVSFARSVGVDAEIGGFASYHGGEENGLGQGPGCTSYGHPLVGAETVIGNSVESIEGSPHDDVLVGNGARNILLGRGGDDVLQGAGGDDFLVGGLGVDSFFGEAGADRLYARDDAPDNRLDCGPESPGDVAAVDPADPKPRHCRTLGGP